MKVRGTTRRHRIAVAAHKRSLGHLLRSGKRPATDTPKSEDATDAPDRAR